MPKLTKVRYRTRITDVFNPDSDSVVKQTEKRSKSGCLTCRKRKKKCDEARPRCTGCKRNLLDCVWVNEAQGTAQPEFEKKDGESFINFTINDLAKDYDHDDEYKFSKVYCKQWTEGWNISMATDGCLVKLCSGKTEPLEKFPNSDQLNEYESISIPSPKFVEFKAHRGSTREPSPLLKAQDRVVDSQEGEFQLSTANSPAELANWKELFDLQLEPYNILKESSPALSYLMRSDTLVLGKNDNNWDSASPKILRNSSLTPANDLGLQLEMTSGVNKLDMNVHSNYGYLYDNNNYWTVHYSSIIEKFDKGELADIKNFCDDEALLFYACVKEFIPKIGPQDTHPMLTTGATFIPQVENNPVMKEVFLCCGATYLEWYDKSRFSSLSNELYENSQKLINKYLSENELVGVELWLLASFQLLCLRNKITLSRTVDDCVQCLSNSYRIIKNTYYISEPQAAVDRNKTDSSTPGPLDFGFQNLTYEIENQIMSDSTRNNELKSELILQPHERMYIESFIYNYSVAILFANDVSDLPNPFLAFKELSHVLRCPIYHCEFEWMNNPVLGSALDAFEILAKVSFIARVPMPLDPRSLWYQRAQQLQNMSAFYTSPVIPMHIKKLDKQKYASAKLSFLVGKIVTKSCYLLITKILQYQDFNHRDYHIQMIVTEMLHAYRAIPRYNNIWGILPWSLVVSGLFVLDERDREDIFKYLGYVGEISHNQSTFKLKAFLKKAWGKPTDEGINMLFSREDLCKVTA